jgi:hypothetical protein
MMLNTEKNPGMQGLIGLKFFNAKCRGFVSTIDTLKQVPGSIMYTAVSSTGLVVLYFLLVFLRTSRLSSHLSFVVRRKKE